MILSMKNIYKLLMSNDFPIYSDSVIPEKMRKGQTLLRFWQSMAVEDFRTEPCGKGIWRNDGKRNRYLSNLCNRSGELKLYSDYSKEIAAQTIKRCCCVRSGGSRNSCLQGSTGTAS